MEDAIGGFVEVGDEGGVVESCEGGGEEGFGGFLIGEVSGGEDAVNEGESGFVEGFCGVPVFCKASRVDGGWGGCRSGLLGLGWHKRLRGRG